jgi:hypothetical protein
MVTESGGGLLYVRWSPASKVAGPVVGEDRLDMSRWLMLSLDHGGGGGTPDHRLWWSSN